MENTKYNSLFCIIFFFIQGVILTFIVMISIFNYKVTPVMQKKDYEIELLMERLKGGNKTNGHNHSGSGNYKIQSNEIITI